jgi:hypothetical protein
MPKKVNNETVLTLEQWNALKVGDEVKDVHYRTWIVESGPLTSRIPGLHINHPYYFARCSGIGCEHIAYKDGIVRPVSDRG